MATDEIGAEVRELFASVCSEKVSDNSLEIFGIVVEQMSKVPCLQPVAQDPGVRNALGQLACAFLNRTDEKPAAEALRTAFKTASGEDLGDDGAKNVCYQGELAYEQTVGYEAG